MTQRDHTEALKKLILCDSNNEQHGFFGPGSHLWRNHQYRIRALAYPLAVILINTNSVVCEINCRYFNNVNELIERGLVTRQYSFAFIFGDVNTAIKASVDLTAIHRHVQHKIGTMMRKALEPELMLWVWASMFYASKKINELLFAKNLFNARTYREYYVMAQLIGIPEHYLPQTMEDFDQYWNKAFNERVVVTAQSKNLIDSMLDMSIFDVFFAKKIHKSLRFMFKPLDSFIRVFCIYALPHQVASAFRLYLTPSELKKVQKTMKCIRFLHAILPRRMTVKRNVRELIKSF